MLATGAVGGLVATRWRYAPSPGHVGAPGDGGSGDGGDGSSGGGGSGVDELPANGEPPGDVRGAASAEQPAERIALDRRIGFPVQLPVDLVLADNFSGGHRGVDMWRADAAPGHPLVACVDGVLVERNVNAGRQGNSWVLQASDGYAFRYHHLDEFAPDLDVGSEVRLGDVLGTMGSTGNAGGPHLHFEVRPTGPIGTAVDPMEYIAPPPTGVTVL